MTVAYELTAQPSTDQTAGPGKAIKKRRDRAGDILIRQETDVDFDATAKLANEGFGFPPGTFRAERLRWLYTEAFSDGTTVFGAYAGDRKVGHFALLHHSLMIEGRIETAVSGVDLFILPAFRSKAAITGLYGAVETLCQERKIRFMMAMPNEKSASLNRRYLKLADLAALAIRIGCAWPLWPSSRIASSRVDELDPATGMALLDPYCDHGTPGLYWTGARLWSRLQKPDAHYAIHAAERLLAISAPRSDKRTSHTLICGLFPRPGAIVRRRDVTAVIAAACRMHRKPLFVYTGLNAAVPAPGVLLPGKLRPSKMILQMRDLSPGPTPVSFERFEPLDFDFG